MKKFYNLLAWSFCWFCQATLTIRILKLILILQFQQCGLTVEGCLKMMQTERQALQMLIRLIFRSGLNRVFTFL